MKLYAIFVFLLVELHYEDTQAYQTPELRMDDNIWYLKHQDIVKAINRSEPPWLYGYSYDPATVGRGYPETPLFKEGDCIYFRKEDLNSTNVRFTKHNPEKPKEAKESEKQGQKEQQDKPKERQEQQQQEPQKPKDEKKDVTNLYGKFFNTSIKNIHGVTDKRNTSNGITVTKNTGESVGESFKLLYTDYIDCSILRPVTLLPSGQPADDSDHSYVKKEKGHCILLLSEAAARNKYIGRKPKDLPRGFTLSGNMPRGLPEGMPKLCKLVFRGLCGEAAELKKVFDEKCPAIPNALGC